MKVRQAKKIAYSRSHHGGGRKGTALTALRVWLRWSARNHVNQLFRSMRKVKFEDVGARPALTDLDRHWQREVAKAIGIPKEKLFP